ncbi:MAG: group II truncated hemoglobin [Phycisphaerales bacterium]
MDVIPSSSSSSPFGPENTPFEAIGGLEAVRLLTARFYHHMANDPACAATRALYPADLAESEEKLFEFLVGWLGGPQTYIQKHGHPRLRLRHAPFRIDETARDHWLMCMSRAMDERGIEGDLRDFLDARFTHVANFLRNVD